MLSVLTSSMEIFTVSGASSLNSPMTVVVLTFGVQAASSMAAAATNIMYFFIFGY